MSAKPYYKLYEDGAAHDMAAIGGAEGGDYVWRCEAAAFGGVTLTLQQLGLDQATWTAVKDNANADVTLTATGQKAMGIAQGAVLRVVSSGSMPAGLKSVLAGI